MNDSALDITKPITKMVSRAMANFNSTFFLVVDQKYHESRPFFVWAGNRADAVETIEILGRWKEGRLPHRT